MKSPRLQNHFDQWKGKRGLMGQLKVNQGGYF